jgi:hypothetical protein
VTRNLLLLAALLLPAACAGAPTDKELAADCAASGYSAEGYIACLTSSFDGAAAQRAQAAVQRARAFEVLGAMGERLANPPQPPVQPTVRLQTSCRSRAWGIVCN